MIHAKRHMTIMCNGKKIIGKNSMSFLHLICSIIKYALVIVVEQIILYLL